MDLAIDINNLGKTYKRNGKMFTALEDFSLQVPQGIVFGLLGPNGAGKSTLINIIANTVKKTTGSVKVCGVDLDKDPLEISRLIGYVPQELGLDRFLNVYETLDVYASLFGIAKKDRITEELLQVMGLTDKRNSMVASLSGGMQRRVLVCKAMVHNPKVLFLDEPTAGVDVELRDSLLSYVKNLNKQKGVTVILTTHYLQEAELLCDNIAIMNKGKVLINKPKDELIHSTGSKTISFLLTPGIAPQQEWFGEIPITIDGFKISYSVRNSDGFRLADVIAILNHHKVDILDMTSEETTLEEIFRTQTKL